jgi:exopolysaccharide production protein ExoY
MDGSTFPADQISQPVSLSAIPRTDRRIPTAKRLFDVASAAAVLIAVAPLMLLIYFLVKLDGGPAIFAHRRVGQNGQDFFCYKFRSMFTNSAVRLEELLRTDSNARDEWARDHKLRNDPRITPLGRFLRASSLDELPQLINIIRGDMSVVGPRPIVHAEITRYGYRFASYCNSRPGLTGIWQVSGRNDVSYRKRVAMDVLYSRRSTFQTDLKIVLMTIPAVLLSKGSY